MSELIKQISEILGKIETDLITASLAMVLLVFAMFCNQALGAVMARTGNTNTFDPKRLGRSFLKGLLICLSILIFCIVLDVFPVLLERVNIIGENSVVSTVVTVLQVITILIISITKYCKEVYEKLLTLFEVTQDEVSKVQNLNDYNVDKFFGR